MKPLCQFVLIVLLGVVSFSQDAAQIPDIPLKFNWYKTSIIIFTRPETSNENTEEMLFVDALRSYPGNTQAFPFDTEQTKYFNALSLRTALALEWPKLAMLDPIVNQHPPDMQDSPESPTPLDMADFPVNIAIQPVDPLIIQDIPDSPFSETSPANGDGEPQPFSEEPQPFSEELQPPGKEPQPIDGEPQPPGKEPQQELVLQEEPSDMEIALEAFLDYENNLENQSLLPLPEDEHLLEQELTRLRRRDSYSVLYSATWNQAIPDRNNPVPILIQAGTQRFGIFELEGTIAITLGRYLHAKAELWLHKLPLGLESAETVQDIQWMQIDESRRMRSTELHYLDHPKFGVLIRVDPVEIPEQLVTLWSKAHLPKEPAVTGNTD